MSTTLPDLVDPRRAADTGATLAGRLPLAELPRLAPLLFAVTGEAEYRLAFSRDPSRRALVQVEVEAMLTLRCERCLEAMEHRVASVICLAVVAGLKEADELPERYDPLLVGDERIRPRDLIEDELLLGLPQIARHPGLACGGAKAGRVSERRSEHPFAVLADWQARR